MKIYFIGICGTATGNVAILTKRLGHEVMGSDSGMYEPMKGALANAGVDAREGWSPVRLDSFCPDLVVVGNAISRMNAELEFVLSCGKYEYTSLPDLIGRKLIGKRKSLTISGTHGKTTTTSLAAYLLRANGIDAGWLVGGIPANLPEGGSNLGSPDAPFVIEGDEYDSAFFDKRSKFIHYRPYVLVVNNIEFDHADIFRDIYDVKRTFTHVRRIVNPNGAIVENGDDENIASLEPTPWTRRIRVGTGRDCDVVIKDFVQSGQSSSFKLVSAGGEKAVEWPMQGEFNARNAAMAAAGVSLIMGRKLIDIDLSSLAKFTGVKRRQEVIGATKDAKVIAVEDFGHHPTAIRLTLSSLRQKYPDCLIYACFEPRSNTARTSILQSDFERSLELADRVYIGQVKANRLSAGKKFDASAAAQRHPGKFFAFDSNGALLKSLENDVDFSRKTVCVFFSNGSFDDIHKTFAREISQR